MTTESRFGPGSLIVLGTSETAARVVGELRAAFGAAAVQLDSPAALKQLLAAQTPSVVVCIAGDKQFSFKESSVLLTEAGLDHLPVIMVAATGAEPDALAALQRGSSAWVSVQAGGLSRLAGEVMAAAARLKRTREQKDREILIRHSEARFRAIFDGVTVGVALADQAYAILDTNPALQRMLATSHEDLSGRLLPDLVHPEDREAASSTLEGSPPEGEWRFATLHGSTIWCRVRVSEMDEAHGQSNLKVVMVEDTTATREAQAALTRRDRILEAITQGSELLLRPTSWDGSIALALEKAGQAAGVSRAYIFENSTDEAGCLRYSITAEWATAGIASQMGNRALHGAEYRTDGSSRYVATLGSGEIIAGPIRDFLPHERVILEQQGIKSVLVVPIFSFGRWWGYLGFADCAQEREWAPLEVDALRLLGTTLGAAIERRSAEEAMRRSEEQFRSLIENAADIIILIHPDGTIAYGSPSFERVLGYTPGDYLAREYAALIHEDDRDIAQSVLSEVHGNIGVVRSVEHRVRHRDGHYLVLDAIAHAVVDEHGHKRIVANARDITQQKLAEAEQTRLEAQVQHSQKLESLGVLAGGIAHDFNNLLTGILGFANLAQTEIPAESPARDSIEQIELVAKRAAGLTKQMLAYSGKGKFVTEAVDLGEVVRDMSHLLEISVAGNCHTQFDLGRNLPAVEADVSQMRQVILNLVLNASEAIGDDEGSVRVSTGLVECTPAYLAEGYLKADLAGGAYVFLDVEDSGCGMDTEILGRIFDPFFTTKFTGRGLGLAAVLGIVRGHKGTIHVASSPGQGTKFRVLLPASGKPAQSLADSGRQTPVWRGTGTVLVVDDDQTVRSIAKRMLEKSGFMVITAANGREALDLFAARTGEICLVLLDLTMPGMSGDEVFKEIQMLRPDLPVVLCSGYDLREAVDKLSLNGYAGFMQKPFRMDEMVQTVRRAIERSNTPLTEGTI